MPNVELTYKPGIIRDASALSSMGGFIDGDHVRWARGYMCPIGGYTKFAGEQTFSGIARGAHAWVSLIGDPQLAWGTAGKLYAYPGSTITDITPIDNAPTPGPVNGTGGSGYGAGAYGIGGYGAPFTSGFRAQTWSLSNFGEALIATFSGGATYAWEPYTMAATEQVTNGDFASAFGWALGTGWSIGAGVATKTAGTEANLSCPITLTAGKTYRLTIDIPTLTAGTLTPLLDLTIIGPAWTTAGAKSLLFVCPAGVTTLNLKGSSAFAGTIDNVSIKHEDKAYRIEQAPYKASAQFVDIRGFVVLLGATEVDGDENPLNVRWCDRNNYRSWVPDTDNLAGEVPLQGGSRLVGGLSTRGQNLIWSDTTLFTMQYTGGSQPAFVINPVGQQCGLIGPHAAAEADGAVFWMSNAGQFYMYNGAVPQVIDCPSRKFYFDDLAPGQDDKIYCWINSGHGEVWWSYASKRDGVECSRYIGYNWRENYWTDGTFPRSSWVPAGIFTSPIGFSTDGRIYYHETGTSADGGVLSGFAQTGRMQIGKGDRLMAVIRVWPDIKDQQGAFSMQWTFYPSAQGAGVTYPPDMLPPGCEKVDFRRTGREASIRFAWSDYGVSGSIGKMMAEVRGTGAIR